MLKEESEAMRCQVKEPVTSISGEQAAELVTSISGEQAAEPVTSIYGRQTKEPVAGISDEQAAENQEIQDAAETSDKRTPANGSTAMLIRIFGRKDHEPYGDIVHYELKKPVPYKGSAELVLRIDAISTSSGIDHLPKDYWQEETESPPPRVQDTIYLQLIGRQHTSIQGRIWGRVTRKKYVSFRSALELIRLLSEAG